MDCIDRFYCPGTQNSDFLKKQKEVCGQERMIVPIRSMNFDHMIMLENRFPKKFADDSGKILQPEYWYLKTVWLLSSKPLEFLEKQLRTIRSLRKPR